MTVHLRRRGGVVGPAALVVTVLGCSGDNLTLPQPEVNVLLTVVTGNAQTGTVGEGLPKPLIIELRDEQNVLLVGRKVAFVTVEGPAAARLSPDTAVTDGEGQAVAQWTLGKVPGSYIAEARVAPVDPRSTDTPMPVAQFVASAEPGAPDTLRPMSQVTQNGKAGQPVADPPVVRVVDRYGNPLQGVAVNWTVTAGSGTVSAPVTTTDAAGRTTVTWTTGLRLGVHRLSATLNNVATGSPASFTAIVFF